MKRLLFRFCWFAESSRDALDSGSKMVLQFLWWVFCAALPYSRPLKSYKHAQIDSKNDATRLGCDRWDTLAVACYLPPFWWFKSRLRLVQFSYRSWHRTCTQLLGSTGSRTPAVSSSVLRWLHDLTRRTQIRRRTLSKHITVALSGCNRPGLQLTICHSCNKKGLSGSHLIHTRMFIALAYSADPLVHHQHHSPKKQPNTWIPWISDFPWYSIPIIFRDSPLIL